MKNPEIVETRTGSIAYQLGLNHSSFQKFCTIFEIDLGMPFDKDKHLSQELARHLFKYQLFARRFDIDYYSDKTPADIAYLIGRDEQDVLVVLKELLPDLFITGVYRESDNYPLRYLSSFLIDIKLGGDYDFLRYQKNV